MWRRLDSNPIYTAKIATVEQRACGECAAQAQRTSKNNAAHETVLKNVHKDKRQQVPLEDESPHAAEEKSNGILAIRC